MANTDAEQTTNFHHDYCKMKKAARIRAAFAFETR